MKDCPGSHGKLLPELEILPRITDPKLCALGRVTFRMQGTGINGQFKQGTHYQNSPAVCTDQCVDNKFKNKENNVA